MVLLEHHQRLLAEKRTLQEEVGKKDVEIDRLRLEHTSEIDRLRLELTAAANARFVSHAEKTNKAPIPPAPPSTASTAQPLDPQKNNKSWRDDISDDDSEGYIYWRPLTGRPQKKKKKVKEAVFTANQYAAAGYSAKDCANAGYSGAELKDGGFSLKQIASTGFNVKEAGFTANQCAAAGYSLEEVRSLGFEASSIEIVVATASGGRDSTAKLWRNGQCIETLQGHSGSVNFVAFSPHDPDLLATASGDKTAKLWRNGQCIETLQGHSNQVCSVAFSAMVI